MKRWCALAAAVLGVASSMIRAQTPVGTAFQYQAELRSGGVPVAAPIDVQFALFPAESNGGQIGSTIQVFNLTPSQGRFSVPLDFGAVFGPDARWMEIGVRSPAGAGAFVTLTPRQRITIAPVAAFALAGNPGPQGATGPQGPIGPDGPPGPTGLIGATGATGPAGPQGLQGLQGPTGLTGATGSQGPIGLTGAAGLQGPIGFTGPTGLQGPVGPTGATGSQGLPGFVTLPYTGSAANPIAGVLNITNTTGPAIQAFGNSGQPGLASYSPDAGAYAVFGRNTGTSGAGKGGWFQSFSTGGTGVHGNVTAATGTTYGVYGESASVSGYGVYGITTDNVGVKGYASGTTGANYGVYGESDSANGYGVYGISAGFLGVRGASTAATGTAYGVYGSSSSTSGYGVFGSNPDNVGVRGEATGTAGINYGVYGTSASTGGYGVFGAVTGTTGTTRGGYFQTSSTGGRGVEGANLATSGANYGGYFFTNSVDGTGVFASSAGDTGVQAQSTGAAGRGVFASAFGSGITTGLWGEANSTTGRGVFGDATAASGSTYGVRGESASTSGRGVFGWATASTGDGWGVYGRTNSPNGYGVRGYASATTAAGDLPIGVFGEVATDRGYGVYGLGDFYGTTGRFNNAVTGFGVFSFGTLGASGLKPFRIDHPDDPENKYLLHYSSESPECLNFYSGTATLDGQGSAVIDLPAYFSKINRDPRYQLTAVGAPMPLLHVAVEISAGAMESGSPCSFSVAGGAPGGKVSWRVEAVRHDLYAQNYGAPVEMDKPAGEKGTYQHPEFYGKPIERRVDYIAPNTER
ncbi:MAG: hypothetical protein ACKVU4_11305 [Phycisphaerales bacterium]